MLTLTSSFANGLVTVTLTGDSDVTITDSSGTLRVNGLDVDSGPVSLSDVTEIQVAGGAGDNQIDLSAISTAKLPILNRVVINAGAGDDNISGSQIADEIFADEGNDFALGNGGNDLIRGGAGDDVILGAAGSDRLFGDEGNDSVLGQGASLDLVSGGPGMDFIDGGSGGDTLVESIAGAYSVDNSFATNHTTGEVDQLLRIENVSITGSDGPDQISAAQLFGLATLDGGLGNDILTGTEFPDVLIGFVGADVLGGRGGNDTMIGGGGNDRMSGGPGDDFFRGNGGDDVILGGDGNDAINGLQGRDILEGDAGNDVILGGDAEDTIRAGAGDDFADGEEGDDLLAGGAGNDVLIGSMGDDIADGGVGNDLLFGGAGMDMLFGREGDDLVKGQGHSRDSLSGGEGADNLIGLESEMREAMEFDSPFLLERSRPAISAKLSNDTGAEAFAGDLITSDPSIAGRVLNVVAPATGELRSAAGVVLFAVDPATGDFQIDGNAILATDIADGETTLGVAIVDGNGEVTQQEFSFTLDRHGPGVVETTPNNAATVTDLTTAVFTFDDIVDPDSVSPDDFLVTNFGEDGIFGTADDSVVPVSGVEVAGQEIGVSPVGPLFSSKYRIEVLDGKLIDRAGNTSGNGASLEFTNIDTTVRWTGADGDWENPSNWSTGNVPVNGDRVVIDVGGDVTVRYRSSVQLSSFALRGNLDMNGGWLSVTEPSQITGGLSMDGAEIFLSGIEASLDVAGASNVDQSTIRIEDGASFTAPNLGTLTNSFFRADGSTQLQTPAVSDVTGTRFHLSGGAQLAVPIAIYDATENGPLDSDLIIVEGAGSLLDLSSATTLRDAFGGWFQSVTRLIEARDGGRIDLSGITTIEGPQKLRDRLELSEVTGGRIEIGNVESTTSGPVRFAISGDRSLPFLATAGAIEFHPGPNSTLDVPILVTLTSGSIEVTENTTLTLPLLTTLQNTTIRMTDSTSVLATPLVTGADNSRIHLSGGAMYELPVTSLDLTDIPVDLSDSLIVVEGTGSTLELKELTSFRDAFIGWIQPVQRMVTARDGGVIDLSAMTSIEGPANDRDTLQFASSNGGRIVMDSVGQTTGGTVGLALSGVAQSFAQLQSSSALSIHASNGTQIVLPQLATINSGSITVETNSSVSLPSLATMNFTTVTLTDTTANLSTPHLDDADNSRFFLSGGATYTLPVITYDVSNVDRLDFEIIRVEGAGSQLNMTTVEMIRDAFGGWVMPVSRQIQALDGGIIDLALATSIEGPSKSTDRLEFVAAGGGVINLPELENQIGGPVQLTLSGVTTTLGNLESATALHLQLAQNANIVIPGLSSIQNGSVFVGPNSNANLPLVNSINQSTITLVNNSSLLGVPNLTNVDNTRFFLSGGAQLALPNVQSYDISNIDPRVSEVITISGTNTRLEMNQVQTLTALFPAWITAVTHPIRAVDGGRLGLVNLSTITGPTIGTRTLLFGISGNGTMPTATNVTASGNTEYQVDGVQVSLATFEAAS